MMNLQNRLGKTNAKTLIPTHSDQAVAGMESDKCIVASKGPVK
jgi:hypothetical protein